MNDLDILRENYNELARNLDCGDNSCHFKKSGGMRTNGGCRCFDSIMPPRKARQIRNVVLAVKRLLEGDNA